MWENSKKKRNIASSLPSSAIVQLVLSYKHQEAFENLLNISSSTLYLFLSSIAGHSTNQLHLSALTTLPSLFLMHCIQYKIVQDNSAHLPKNILNLLLQGLARKGFKGDQRIGGI